MKVALSLFEKLSLNGCFIHWNLLSTDIRNHGEERGLGEEFTWHKSRLSFVILVILSRNLLRTGGCSHYELDSHISFQFFSPQLVKGGRKGH